MATFYSRRGNHARLGRTYGQSGSSERGGRIAALGSCLEPIDAKICGGSRNWHLLTKQALIALAKLICQFGAEPRNARSGRRRHSSTVGRCDELANVGAADPTNVIEPGKTSA
jgi:hypothetical protein